MNFVHALNGISSQVWAFLAMLLGSAFIWHGDKATGEGLLMAAFALFKSTSESKTTVQGAANSDIKVSQ